ncbi:HNH endonuclease family protein [Streptomyces sp. SP18BB07]|uniref:HNH endonuclease family protein n=1 Tax=Streptomyces sp. SP18BB07 TaxID=3002522 RepID=UPI002E79925D|nr:HNH endonuclease family protein [Streptomyces sp. SP18BB07]MEE1761469.1 HNH endonuclease family protein [Streptomyces sp. SP18BB07]
MLLWDAVDALPVAAERREGYNRLREFGDWIDADRDGCNTRQEVLLGEAIEVPAQTGRCTLEGGRWYSYYDDQYPTRGIDIDHLVPLAESWDSGAWQWERSRRVEYANDLSVPHHLVAVTASSNRQKSDKDVAQWLPPYEPARCPYITEWVSVKARYGLTVDTTEKQTLTHLAAQCPNITLP